ncbi:MAG: glutathione peroxidase, partial [Gammaproteobacteria bacterium]|nr:glutathione peroxidase [Gammaproteobacteria bacterium]
MSIYEMTAKDIEGRELSLASLQGRVLVVVNVASRCGFTPQYAGLEALQRQYGDRGLTVLGFPCDQFGHQEPGDEAEIRNFCQTQYDVSFPMFSKI